MTEAQAELAITQAWLAGIAARQPTINLDILDNEAATTAGVDTWLRMTIIGTTRVQVTMGSPGSCRFENRGYISVEIYTASDKGTDPSARIAADVRAVLERKSFAVGQEAVETFSANPKPAGSDPPWYRRQLLVSYLWWETA